MNQSAKSLNYQRLVKTGLDRLVAAIVLIILSPIMIVVAIAIYLRMGSPIIFAQQRPGKNSQIFTCYKFRTMTNDLDADGELQPDAERLTNLGIFLRKTSLDELPQLFSILKGEMSFVGPRPLLIDYLPYYSEREQQRHSVLPGITGLAQINGRNQLRWDERLELDVQYVEKQSFYLDVYILMMTVVKVIQRSGVDIDPSSEGNFAEYRQNQI